MSRTDVLPRRQADLLTWSATFRKGIVADPQAVGLSEQQAAHYSQLHDRFAETYALSQSPVHGSKANTRAKDEAMMALRSLARQYARIVHGTPGVTLEQKRSLGLSLRGRGGKNPRIPRPGTAPLVHVRIEDGNTLHLRLRDRDRSHRKGMPAGVRGALVFMYVGDVPPIDFAKWQMVGGVTRTDSKTVLPSRLAPGTRVWIRAGWTNPRMQRGPLSEPKCVRINFDVPPNVNNKQNLSDLKRTPLRLAA